MGGMNNRVAQVVLASILGLVSFLAHPIGLPAAEPAAPAKPVFLYSRYFNAEGETRYLPDGTYEQVLQRLQTQFEVRVNHEPLTDATLAGVKVVLIANPRNQAVGNHPAPHHFSVADIAVLTR